MLHDMQIHASKWCAVTSLCSEANRQTDNIPVIKSMNKTSDGTQATSTHQAPVLAYGPAHPQHFARDADMLTCDEWVLPLHTNREDLMMPYREHADQHLPATMAVCC